MSTMNARQHRSAREKYGEELRRRRTAAHLTQDALASEVVCSPTLISHFEAGRRLPNPKDAERIDQVLGTDGWFVRWLEDLDQNKFPHHFEEAAELEKQASELRQFGLSLVPGLLQTPDYARAVFQGYRTNFTAQEIDQLVVNRMERGQILKNPEAPVLWTLLDESVLRRSVGGPATMTEQLDKLLSLAEAGRQRLHVIPFTVGAHALLEGLLTLMSFPDAAPVAYSEGIAMGQLLDDPASVTDCRSIFDLAMSESLPQEQSLALIGKIAKEFRDAA